MDTSPADIKQLIKEDLDYLIQLRKKFHQIPEPSLKEHKTRALIIDTLKPLGLRPVAGEWGTGVVYDLCFSEHGPVFALRADMDGLPVPEKAGTTDMTAQKGFSHSCGHDGHMTVTIGVARLLQRFKNRLHGRVRFIFQPAEELGQGAKLMLKAGVLNDARYSGILGLHAAPKLPLGTLACREGTLMAAMTTFTINITGKGGHSARPENANNPLNGISEIIPALHDLTSENRVVVACIAAAGQKSNVIPASGVIRGTCRTFSSEFMDKTCAEIRSIAESVSKKHGLQAGVSFPDSCPPLVISRDFFHLFQDTGTRLKGAVKIETLPAPGMGAEDFSYYLEKTTGLFFRLGMGAESPELHTDAFCFNDRALEYGILFLSDLLIFNCKRKPEPV